jgi:plasmid stabilization system protein ParE
MIWTTRALANLSRVRDFLLEKSPSAAMRAIAAIHEGLKQLEQFPQMGRPVQERDHDERDWLIHFGREGYKVRYRNDDGQIIILALRHMRENEFYPSKD